MSGTLHRIVSILLIAAVLFTLFGCAKADTEQESAEEPSDLPAESSEAEGGQEEQAQSSTIEEQTPVSGPAAPSNAGALQVVGTALTDCNGNPVQLRGVSTHGLAWFPDYVNEACFAQLRSEWGANVIRLAMYTEEYGGYCSGGDRQALKDLIRKGVQYAKNQDMYVIIDWHVLSDHDPNTHLEEAKAFFQEMSAEFSREEHVLYEICNEPNNGVGWDRIKHYAEQVIPVIRANDAEAVILVGTPNWSQYVDEAAADPIRGEKNIMYTLHFYAATHREDLRSRMVSAAEQGLPIFVSEYGICDASGNGAIDTQQADQWVQEMDRYGISYVAWNLSNKEESSAILKSSCNKVNGFAEEDLSDSGKWLYCMLTGEKPAAEEPATSQTEQPPQAAPADTAPANGETVRQQGKLEVSAVLRSSWDAQGKTAYLYDVTVYNRSEQPCTAWEIDLSFDGPIQLSDGWNGKFTVSGSTLHIASVEYNGAIGAGASVDNIGFIVVGGSIAAP